MKSFLACLLVLFFLEGKAQLSVDTSYSASRLIQEVLMGNHVKIAHVKVTGQKVSYGKFSVDTNVIGIKQGVLITNGNAFAAIGPNNIPFMTGEIDWKTKKGNKGDKDLDKINKLKTFDATVIEFDFIAMHNKITFNYVFGSEEYREFANSNFNDVFAFIVTGGKYRKENMATFGEFKFPVSINNINQSMNDEYYVDNDPFVNFTPKNNKSEPKGNALKRFFMKVFKLKQILLKGYLIDKQNLRRLDSLKLKNFQYDGFTTLMTTSLYVVPYQKYHIKLVIADVGDAVLDSGVFLEEGSFSSSKDSLVKGFIAYETRRNFNFDSAFNIRKIPEPKKDTLLVMEEKRDAEFDQFEFTDVYFGVDSYEIPDSAKLQLNKLADYLKKNQKTTCILSGYTDNTGSHRYNKSLSDKRSKSVTDYLKEKGIAESRITYSGHSEENPLANNNTANGRAVNRRVEIELIKEE